MTRMGRLNDWWTPADVKAFEAAGKALIAQYDAYEIFPGANVKGAFTLGENIGDLAGLTVAYDAYKHSLGGSEAPVLDGTTGDQRFYLGWAQVWRRNYREANLRQRLITDPHSPSEQRAGSSATSTPGTRRSTSSRARSSICAAGTARPYLVDAVITSSSTSTRRRAA